MLVEERTEELELGALVESVALYEVDTLWVELLEPVAAPDAAARTLNAAVPMALEELVLVVYNDDVEDCELVSFPLVDCEDRLVD